MQDNVIVNNKKAIEFKQNCNKSCRSLETPSFPLETARNHSRAQALASVGPVKRRNMYERQVP